MAAGKCFRPEDAEAPLRLGENRSRDRSHPGAVRSPRVTTLIRRVEPRLRHALPASVPTPRRLYSGATVVSSRNACTPPSHATLTNPTSPPGVKAQIYVKLRAKTGPNARSRCPGHAVANSRFSSASSTIGEMRYSMSTFPSRITSKLSGTACRRPLERLVGRTI